MIIILTKLDDQKISKFYGKVKKSTKELICCKYGNFLIQELLKRDLPEIHRRIRKEILSNFKFFLSLKYTKYVICPLIGPDNKSGFTEKLARSFLSISPNE